MDEPKDYRMSRVYRLSQQFRTDRDPVWQDPTDISLIAAALDAGRSRGGTEAAMVRDGGPAALREYA